MNDDATGWGGSVDRERVASAAEGLHYERAGEGPPLILVHGLGGTHLLWAPVVDLLAAHHEVIAVDLPGFGHSEPLPDGVPATPANLAASIAALCRQLSDEPPALAGNSLGGWVALEVARSGGAGSVCGFSPAGLWRRPLGPRRGNLRALGARVRWILPLALASRRLRTGLLQTTMAHPERLSRGEASAVIGDWIRSPGYHAANDEMRAGVFENPEEVTVPVTIAWGAEDRLLRRPHRDRLPPQTRFVVLEDAGHTPTWDAPERVAELILQTSATDAGGATGGQAGSGSFSPGQEPVRR